MGRHQGSPSVINASSCHTVMSILKETTLDAPSLAMTTSVGSSFWVTDVLPSLSKQIQHLFLCIMLTLHLEYMKASAR